MKCSYTVTAAVLFISAIIAEPIHIPFKRLRRTHSNAFAKRSLVGVGQTTSSALYNDLGQAYLVEIGIGTPAQNFTVIIDTQSPDLWVPSTDCKQSSCPLTNFNTSASSTFEKLNTTFEQYYNGSINGTYAKETVTLGGITVQHQPFAVVDSVTQAIIADDERQIKKYGGYAAAEGVLGVGYKYTETIYPNLTLYDPLLYTMANQSLISQNLFSIYTNSVYSEGWVGEITLGGVDTTKYTGSLAYAQVLPVVTSDNGSVPLEYDYWLVEGQSLSVLDTIEFYNTTTQQNQTSLQPTSIWPFAVNDLKYVTIDTGTSMSYVGGLYAAQLVTAVTMKMQPELDNDTGCYLVDCGLKNSTKYVEVGFARYWNNRPGTVRIKIPLKNLIQPQHFGDSVLGEDDTCIFSICSWPHTNEDTELADMPVFLFGDSFLRSVYTVFDTDNNRIGFASAKGSGTIVTSSRRDSNVLVNQ